MKEYIKKICMCGDPGVGKTSLIRRFVCKKYDDKYLTTLGTVISRKLVQFPDEKYGVNLQIWDISGQSEFKRIQASAFRSCNGAIAVCDVTRADTAKHLFEWLANLHNYTKEKIPVIVLANKYDLVTNKPDKMLRINKIISRLNSPIFTASAKTGHNVELGFRTLAEGIGTQISPPQMTALEMVAMPEMFENPFALADYLLARFSRTFGDEELGIHLLRRQAENMGNDFRQMPKQEAMRMINRLIEITDTFKGEAEARQLRIAFMQAYRRCKWT